MYCKLVRLQRPHWNELKSNGCAVTASTLRGSSLCARALGGWVVRSQQACRRVVRRPSLSVFPAKPNREVRPYIHPLTPSRPAFPPLAASPPRVHPLGYQAEDGDGAHEQHGVVELDGRSQRFLSSRKGGLHPMRLGIIEKEGEKRGLERDKSCRMAGRWGGRTAFLETSLSSSSLLASMNSLRRLGKLAWLVCQF